MMDREVRPLARPAGHDMAEEIETQATMHDKQKGIPVGKDVLKLLRPQFVFSD